MPREAPAWFRRRGYAHFDWPLTVDAARSLVINPDAVKSHAFLPFLSYVIRTRKHKNEKIVPKDRPIAMAGHADSHIFAFYNQSISPFYEQILLQRHLSSVVLAYRRFPDSKCNIDFANDVFEYIATEKNVTATGIDIEKFFDSLDHYILKQAWCRVIDKDRLPDDHFAVFRAMTRFATVDRDRLFAAFKVPIRTQRNWRYPLCKPAEFRSLVRGGGLIQVNTNTFGIPQGSPMSALLSNMYMLDADEMINELCQKMGARYFRYSDDILLVAPSENARTLEAEVLKVIENQKLRVNDAKTIRSNFTASASGGLECDRPLQYLGFLYNGRQKLIRGASLSRFERTRRDGIKSAERAARKAKKAGGIGVIRRQKLYRRFSHLGKRNFISYAYRAARKMKDNSIRRQLRAHWVDLEREVDKAEKGME